MSFTNPREAMHEIEVDIREGADIIMIKPAIPYLDLIYQAKKNTNLPICAYSVSGEYALIKASGWQGADRRGLGYDRISNLYQEGRS